MELLKKIIAIHAVRALIIGSLAVILGIITLAVIAWGIENITFSTDLLLVGIIGSIWKAEIRKLIDSFFLD